MVLNPSPRQRGSSWTRPFGISAFLGSLGTDEELGKRDDDLNYRPSYNTDSAYNTQSQQQQQQPHHRLGASGSIGGTMSAKSESGGFPWKSAPRGRLPAFRHRKRRFWIGFTLVILLILFFFNKGDARSKLQQVANSVPYTHLGHSDSLSSSNRPPTADRPGTPPGKTLAMTLAYEEMEKINKETIAQDQTFTGPFTLPSIAASLGTIQATGGNLIINNNVLFAAADLLSVASLLPTACEMARHRRNYVHMAIFTRHNISIADIQELNGIHDPEDPHFCPIIWHDCRPDQASVSSPLRAEVAMHAALELIGKHVHPQAVIVDDFEEEEKFFADMMQIRVQKKAVLYTDYSVIELVRGSLPSLSWIAHLGAASLRDWAAPSVDILIQPDDRTLEILPILLKSLSEADYRGLPLPRIIIDLPPSKLSPFVEDALSQFTWPPQGFLPETWSDTRWRSSNLLVIRHRLPTRYLSPEETSLRFLEAFYPSIPDDQHVLLLSPDVSISSAFYQYLYFSMLEYRYGSDEPASGADLAGISLIRPSEILTDSSPFNTPILPEALPPGDPRATPKASKKHPSPFLWQSPSPHATLFFGNKWVELQNFLVNRINAFHQTQDKSLSLAAKKGGDDSSTSDEDLTAAASLMRPKLISPNFPGWLEYAAELFFARGYTILVPGSRLTGGVFATLLPEGYHVPEEFVASIAAAKAKTGNKKDKPEAKGKGNVLKDEPFSMPASLPSALPAAATASPVPLASATELSLLLPPPLVYSSFSPAKDNSRSAGVSGLGLRGVVARPDDSKSPDNGVFGVTPPAIVADHQRVQTEGSSSSLLSKSPFVRAQTRRVLPYLFDLPVLSFSGAAISHEQLLETSNLYVKQFRTQLGGCSEDLAPEKAQTAAEKAMAGKDVIGSMFCF